MPSTRPGRAAMRGPADFAALGPFAGLACNAVAIHSIIRESARGQTSTRNFIARRAPRGFGRVRAARVLFSAGKFVTARARACLSPKALEIPYVSFVGPCRFLSLAFRFRRGIGACLDAGGDQQFRMLRLRLALRVFSANANPLCRTCPTRRDNSACNSPDLDWLPASGRLRAEN